MRLIAHAAIAAALLSVAPAFAQPAAPAPLAIPNPNYASIVLEVSVDRPAAVAWARVGKFCDIREWFGVSCAITSGKDGELGAVRSLNGGGVIEVLVAKTDLSYTYAQPVRVGVPYALYHGTVEAKPVTATTSKLIYSMMFDNSMLPDAAARARDIDNRSARFMKGLQNMKVLAEGGALPAPH